MDDSDTPRPWDAEAGFDASTAAQLLAELDARFRDVELKPLLGGWDFHTFLVDGAWVFRFPKREEVCASLRTEWRVLDALTAVSLPYAVPDHVFRCEGTSTYPRPFSGYPLCHGWPLIERHSHLREGLDTFLQFLDVVATIEVDAPTEAMQDLEPWAEHSRQRLDELAMDESMREATSRLLADAPTWHGAPIFQHNDLGPDHLLCIAGRVTAVIDWADACYADPAADIAGAVIAWGLEPVRRALPRDDAFWGRVRFRTALGAVSMMWFGQSAERPEYVDWGERVLADVV